jgi:Raf kinase inhibitor-like YbhB/YbcL family protein
MPTPTPASIHVRSTAFAGGGPIPARFTCSGADVSPPVSWSGVPGGAQSIALTVIDPDAPGRPFTHWVLFNMPPSTTDLGEGGPLPQGGVEGRNDFGSNGYRGPCPPPGAPHHYHFKLYALDTTLSLRSGASEGALEDAIRGHVLASGELIGTFKR